MRKNISFIVDNALCCGCGACAGICGKQAIGMSRNCAGFLVPVIEPGLCTHCGICASVCPSNADNSYEFPADILKGDCRASYIGYAVSDKIRTFSQSGGIVTGLLAYLLESGKVEHAVVTGFDGDKGEPFSFCASSMDELRQSSGSYYAQTAVCETILKNKGKKQAAVVLGCQAESMKLLERLPGYQCPEYLIGLICAGQNSNLMTTELINKAVRAGEKVIGFRFRDKEAGGWPGNVTVRTGKKTHTIKAKERLMLKPVYELHRCIPCYDQMNIFSDVVCGDPWGIEAANKEKGYTVVVARTEKGLQLLSDAERAGYIRIKEVPVPAVMEGQTVNVRHRDKVVFSCHCFTEGKWLYPYPERVASVLLTLGQPCGKNADIWKRLLYTRQFFLACDPVAAEKLSSVKKKEVRRMYQKSRMIRFPKRIIRFLVRSVSLLLKNLNGLRKKRIKRT